MRLPLIALGAVAVVAGCSPEARESAIARAGQVISFVSPAAREAIEGTEVSVDASAFAPDAIAAAPEDYFIIGIPALSEPALGRVIARNARQITVQSQDGFTAAFADGMLVATRGLGDDLIAADTTAVRAAIRAGGGSVTRRHETLDGRDDIVLSTFDCVVTRVGPEEVSLGVRSVTATKFTETCRNAEVQFENLYWIDSEGEIASSRQYVTLTVAYLRANRI